MACVRILGRKQSAWVEGIDPQAAQTLKAVQYKINACLLLREQKWERGIVRKVIENKTKMPCKRKCKSNYWTVFAIIKV